jgi:hypothetical protein
MTQKTGDSPMMARTRSVQVEFGTDRSQLGGFDQSAMGDLDRMQGAIERFLPEREKAPQFWELWKEIVMLPDEGLQQVRVIGQVVEDLGCRQTVAFQLTTEGYRNTHRSTSFGRVNRYADTSKKVAPAAEKNPGSVNRASG